MAAEGDSLRGEPTRVDNVDSHGRILHASDEFVIINKPHDVRMDGDFPVTVETLVQHWDAKYNIVKFVHQLDYATSGVLCLALTKEAAARACVHFRERTALKTYSALVYGHCDATGAPVIKDGENETNSAPRKRQKVQFTPAFAFFDQHKTQLKKQVESGSGVPSVEGRDELRLLDMRWCEAKRDPEIKQRFDAIAKKDRERVLRTEEASSQSEIGAPTVPADGKYRLETTTDAGTFFISAPIAETDGFTMQVAAGGKRSTTHVVVVATGHYMGTPVTEVQLHPETGRRHQLRVHLSHIGHPIVGDRTYAGTRYSQESAAAPRMMLHGCELVLPFSKSHGGPLRAHAPAPFRVSSEGNVEFS